jgi:hypothetical protein
LISSSYGHNAEFKKNFSWLLKEAMRIGIWNYENYGINEQEYCGIIINRTHPT